MEHFRAGRARHPPADDTPSEDDRVSEAPPDENLTRAGHLLRVGVEQPGLATSSSSQPLSWRPTLTLLRSGVDATSSHAHNQIPAAPASSWPTSTGARHHAPHGQSGDSGPAQWARSALSTLCDEDERAEWFVDCYRLRLDDDCVRGGCNVHGLYDPDHERDDIAFDFLVFCKLAARAGVLPRGWEWDNALSAGADLLGYLLDEADAMDKYGSVGGTGPEQAAAPAGEGQQQRPQAGGAAGCSEWTAVPSLRAAAQAVYGYASDRPMDVSAVERQVRRELGFAPLRTLVLQRQGLFADVGGAAAWRWLADNIDDTPPPPPGSP